MTPTATIQVTVKLSLPMLHQLGARIAAAGRLGDQLSIQKWLADQLGKPAVNPARFHYFARAFRSAHRHILEADARAAASTADVPNSGETRKPSAQSANQRPQ